MAEAAQQGAKQPSVEHFLELIRRSKRGRFKIYIGMSAGVGKTYRMLQEAHTLLLVSFTLILNFPGYIANPITQLTASIRQIAAKNYGEHLHFEGNDEFSDVATAFNEMAERLDAYEHSNLAELLFEKRRMEALIANLQDAVIGLDERQRLLTDAVQSILTDKHLRIETHLAESLPELQTDAEKTAWVLINLLSNTAKYSPEGERIIVEATRENGSVVVSVRDFGPGIEEKYQQRLFKKFFQAPTGNREVSKNGLGLGLAISKDFIAAQGGRIWVESSVGSGARFAFSLPVGW